MAEKKSKLAEIKTKPTTVSAATFLDQIEDEQKRNDSFAILEMMQAATGEEPVLWGNAIVGFGNKRYKSEKTGREVDWFLIGFAPRKANISLHLTIDINKHEEALSKLGKHKTGAGCLYINKLEDVDKEILQSLINIAASRN